MRGIRVHEYGSSKALKWENLPLPDVDDDEIRIKVDAIGLNYTEIYSRKGLYPQDLPFILGSEFSGTVDLIGNNVHLFKKEIE